MYAPAQSVPKLSELSTSECAGVVGRVGVIGHIGMIGHVDVMGHVGMIGYIGMICIMDKRNMRILAHIMNTVSSDL